MLVKLDAKNVAALLTFTMKIATQTFVFHGKREVFK